LVQAAQERANHARLLEQTKQFADCVRSQVAEKSRKLAEMNEWLIAFGRMVANCGTDTERSHHAFHYLSAAWRRRSFAVASKHHSEVNHDASLAQSLSHSSRTTR
jgi:hypothetical protein